jgi:hypothetical protein
MDVISTSLTTVPITLATMMRMVFISIQRIPELTRGLKRAGGTYGVSPKQW